MQHHPNRLWLGIGCLIAGGWTLSLLDTAGKLLTIAGYHVVMIAWVRYTLNTALMTITLVPYHRHHSGSSIWRCNRPGL